MPRATDVGQATVAVGTLLARAADRLRAAGVEIPRQEALLLLEHALGVPRATLLAFPERPVTDAEQERFAGLVARRASREPFAYVVGAREFYGRSFLIDARVLVPRPETETLVEAALGLLRTRSPGSPPLVVDVGTGSGAIACTVAAEAPATLVVASDASLDALAVATGNRDRLGLAGRVQLVRGDLLTWLRRPADLVLANLPYLPPARAPRLMPEVAHFEPPLALFSDDDGLALIRRLLDDARRVVAPGGSLLLEMDPEQIDAVLAHAPWARATVLRDLQGNERVVRLDAP